MSSTQSTSANRALERSAQTSAAPRPEPPRQQGERRNMGEAFASKLQQAAGDEGKGAASTSGQARTGQAARQTRDFDSSERSFSDEGDYALAQMARQVGGAERSAATAESACAEAFDRALIDRIAARIAEVQPGQAGSQVRVDLPAGSLAETVVLQREADGAMAIRVAGADPRLSPSAQGFARQALEAALLRRRVKVGSLSFEKGAGANQRNRSSARSRVV